MLCVAFAAALVSAFFVPPSGAYFAYIDLRVLCLLLSMMLVVKGLQRAGAFSFLVERLLKLVRTTRGLSALLVGVCFFCSMFITNDVALITFVPLGIMILTRTGNEKLLIPVIVLQTVAANLGSMFTPLGNPQNLYLYSVSGMPLPEFLGVMAVPSALSFALLAASCLLIKSERLEAPENGEGTKPEPRKTAVWLALFAVSLLAVLRVIPYGAALALAALCALLLDRKVLASVDYGLLLTFVFLFIFIGNIKSIPAVSAALSRIVGGREMTVGILLSQVISNVPAAMLLSKFTADYTALLVGVNLGGLGTLIASMASVISYKLYAAADGAKKGRYLGYFTLVNVAFLAVLWGASALLALIK